MPKTVPGKGWTSVHITRDLLERLHRRAGVEGRSVSNMLGYIVEDYLRRCERPQEIVSPDDPEYGGRFATPEEEYGGH